METNTTNQLIEQINNRLNSIEERLTNIDRSASIDQIMNIVYTNNIFLTHINKNVCNIFQYMTGIELNKNFVQEREILFDPKNALIDHYNRYLFATENVTESDYVCDIACTCGYGSAMLAKKAKKVIGVDISKPVIDFANKFFATDNLSFVCQDAQNLQLKEEFDVIVSFETIEHIPEPEKFLNAAHKLLKTTGKLICSVPNETTCPYAESRNHFHYRHYTKEQFEQLLNKCGFKIVKLYQQYLDNNYAVEQRSDEGSVIVVLAEKAEQKS